MTVLDRMTTHYLVTALWSTVDYLEPKVTDSPYGPDTFNLDEKYSISDISKEFKAKALAECSQLYSLISHLLTEDEDDLETIGHDFWLTRNHHGAGFWDGDYKNGDEITKIVHSYFSENDDELRDSITNEEAA